MKKMFSFILLAFICICGYAQTIAPALLEEMGRHRDNEKIRVFVIMRQQYDQQQLNLRADQFTTRAERREFVVNELKQFAEASQYDLRRSLSEMQRADLVTEPKVLWIANAISFEATRGAILSLADRSDIMVIDFDKEHYCIPDGEASQPADPTREITSNVTQVNADQVWNLGYTGQGVVVAIIDTGVNYNHLDLADHLWDGGAEFPNHGYDVYDNDNDPMDEHVKYDQYGNIVSHGHGTHCAGTLCGDGTAGSQTGIAPDATLMCLKISDSTGTSNPTIEVDAMQWAVDHGCDIISMSFGGHGHSPATQTLFRNTCVNVLNAGVIAAIAAGNEGNKLSQYPIPDNVALPGGCPPPYLDPDQQQNPGGLSCSVCVGAVDSNDVAADFTSHGPRDWSESDYADYPYTSGSQSEFGLIRPDVCAPGVDIISTDSWNTSGYQTKDGTSMATPCVAGCMALLLSKNPDATPAELCRILEETAVPLSTGKSNIYGYGRVDALAAINAFAYDFSAVCSTGQRLYYNIIHPVDPYVEITCPGTSSTNPWSGYTQPTGNIILPSYVSYGGVIYTVKRIADNAFRDCSGLTGSLTIPNSVTSIGANAFQGCSGFTGSLTIGNSVTTIHNSAFYGCNGFTGSLTIGNSVTTIGNSAFRNCSGFTGSLTIPNSVTLIGEYAFALNSGFTGSLTIPNSVTTIYNGAFHGCNGFTGSLTIGNSVTAIHNYAFYGCSGFTGSLTIGNSVTSIGQAAFYNCTGFTSMTARPETPPTLGTNAFQNVPTGIPVGVPCGSLLDYQDASGWYEFYNMHRIDNDCDLLTYSINDDGVSVTVTGHVDGIIATGSLTIPETTTIDGVTYAVTAIGVEAFRNYTQLTGSLTIPNSVTTIGNNAFRGCTGFTGSLTIPNSVTTIDNDAFRGCTGFNGSLTLPSSLTSLGAFAFYSCSGFTGSLTIPNSLTSVGTCAFCYCTGFTGSLTIPNAVTFLEDWAFGNCTGLTSMTVLPETPPSLGTSVFSNVPTGIPVYVPCGSLWDYRDASGWSVFSNIQCLLETLTVYDGTVTNNRIPAYIFYFDGFTRSQFVIPAADLVEMKDKPISRMTFYTTNSNVPYITDCSVDVYLKTVNYTSISSYETKASCTTVYSGFLNIISTNSGGEMTIYFDSPYTYNGGNLLVGFENTEDNTYQNIHFYGQTVSGASISGASASSTGTIPATQQNFIPKTSFGYLPTCETKSLPYAFGFEEDGEEYCWTMLNCYSTTGVYNSTDAYEGDYCFRFHYTVDPPQYLISPKFEGTIGMNVSFYYKNGSSSWPETFQVGYSTTTQTPNAFIWGEEVTVNSPNDWLLYEDSFPEGTKYVAVKCTSDDQLYLYLDNFSFEPAYCAPEDQCELTFTLTDSYGDGWNGNAIRVVDVASNTVLATMTNVTNDQANAPITETYTLPACNGRILRFEWVKGTWSSECSYTVTNAYGTVILEGTGSNSMNTGDVLGTYLMSCDGLDCWHPFALDATEITSHSATLSWTGYQDSYNVRYRPCIFNFDDGSMGDWTTIDADGDGYNWRLGSTSMGTGYGHNSSNDFVLSHSYVNFVGALTPDNYLVSPQVSLDGIFSFWARAQDNKYPAEHFGVAVSTTSNTDASAFTTIQEWTMTAKSSGAKAIPGATRGDNRDLGTWYQYTVDLSAYAGQMGYVAIRHFNCTDEFILNVDDISIESATGTATWITVENVTNPYTLTGLSPETPYEWEVQGINTDCDGGLTSWSDHAFFTTTEETEVTQTIALAAGINWFSTNVEITLGKLQAALVEAMPGATNIVIQSKTQSTTYNGTRWRGQLNALDVAGMYKITVTDDCEISLNGTPINPAEHPISIPAGQVVWIGFPFSESMTPADAFAGFAVSGDEVSSKTQSTTYNGTRWRGQLNSLEPGKGYIYKSAATSDRVLTFPTSAK